VTHSHKPLDCVYIAASANDARFTRICVASIRQFYPTVAIKLLAGHRLEAGLAPELKRYWDVGVADLPVRDWGWGFIKLEPLFGPPGETFLVVDSDTVMTGPVLDIWNADPASFLVDDEQQTESDTHRLYYDWQRVRAVDSTAVPPTFVFNSGQWFGTAGVLTRNDFAAWIDWSDPRPRHRHTGLFMPGDQGILNYVFNQHAALNGLDVSRRKLLLWPGHGMSGITATAISTGSAPARIIHWAGLKTSRLSAMRGSDILAYFERAYYERLPRGTAHRTLRRITYPAVALRDASAERVQNLTRRILRLGG